MRTRIISLSGIEFDGEALSFGAKTTEGEVTVLDHHRPYITTLTPCEARLVVADKHEEVIPVRGGLIHVDGKNHLTVLVD